MRTVSLRLWFTVVSRVDYNVTDTTLESDSHADTTILGRGCLKLFDYDSPVNVQGYDTALSTKRYNTISGGIVSIHPFTGVSYHLVTNHAIHMPDLDHHLLCPMQYCDNGVTVNEYPRMYCPEPTQESHAIVAMDEYGANGILPFSLRGVTSLINVSPLTLEEFESHSHPRVELTSHDLTWDPSTDVYEDQENSTMDHKGDIICPGSVERRPLMAINSVTISTCSDAADVLSHDSFANVLKSNVNVSHIQSLKSRNFSKVDPKLGLGYVQSKRGKQVDSETLSNRWNIDRRKALNTVQRTTQRGVLTCLHPSLSRCYPINDRILRYKRLPHPVFSDTMKAGVMSMLGNKYGQAYCTQFGWARVHPMKLKSEAHETLSMVFKRDGVPPKIVVDNYKEQTIGKFVLEMSRG